MSIYRHGRYSGYLRPFTYLIDISIINALAIYLFKGQLNEIVFILSMTIAWVLLSVLSKFYEVYRYTRPVTILALIIRQALLYLLIVFAYSGFNNQLNLEVKDIIKYVMCCFLLITAVKFFIYYFLQRYRVSFGGNFRRTVIFGLNKRTQTLEHFFRNKPEYGYNHIKTFCFKDNSNTLESAFQFIKDEYIDEIYCAISELSNKQIAELVDFADNNLRIIKFLPDRKSIYSKKLKYEYYDYIPILALRTIPLEDAFNKFIKRVFDVVFSLFVIVFILSWFIPIIALLIKLESKGPVFFKQARNGINYDEFYCYKFRSMTPNKNAHLHQATRGDQRVTKIGKFIRKTSIDELPQFFNVLLGDMSVVGPRPHMVSHADMYAKNIDKFMVRHFVKPGITGLAQVSGYRGEVETEKDIIGRVKYDIFYIENWSLLLDIKIVFQTLSTFVKGDDKAY